MSDWRVGLVSVIVPVYNRADLVGGCIESILTQTYDNLEIILVNDGSTDNSLQVINRYADLYPERVLVINQNNCGQVRARNNGIRQAKGEFIAFLDSDDTWESEKLALQIPLFSEDVGLVYCGFNEVATDGRRLKNVACSPEMRGNVYRYLLVQNRMIGGSVVVSRFALETVGLFDEKLEAAENWDLWIRISAKFKVDFVNKPLVNYLCHSGNMSSDSERMTKATWKVLQKNTLLLNNTKIYKKECSLSYANYYYIQAVNAFSQYNYSKTRDFIIVCWKYKLFYRDTLIRFIRSLIGVKTNKFLSECKKTLTAYKILQY